MNTGAFVSQRQSLSSSKSVEPEAISLKAETETEKMQHRIWGTAMAAHSGKAGVNRPSLKQIVLDRLGESEVGTVAKSWESLAFNVSLDSTVQRPALVSASFQAISPLQSTIPGTTTYKASAARQIPVVTTALMLSKLSGPMETSTPIQLETAAAGPTTSMTATAITAAAASDRAALLKTQVASATPPAFTSVATPTTFSRSPLPSAHLSERLCIYSYTERSPQLELKLNEPYCGYIGCANSPLEFSVVVDCHNLRKMDHVLNEIYNKDLYILPLAQEKVVKDTACVVKYEDDHWYRALITDVDDSGVSICYIDYGNTEIIQDRHRLMSLKRMRLFNTPPLSLSCKLNGVPDDFPLTSEDSEFFYKTVDPMERMISVKFKNLDQGPPYPVELADAATYQNINLLVLEKLGLYKEPERLPPPPPIATVSGHFQYSLNLGPVIKQLEVVLQIDMWVVCFYGLSLPNTRTNFIYSHS